LVLHEQHSSDSTQAIHPNTKDLTDSQFAVGLEAGRAETEI